MKRLWKLLGQLVILALLVNVLIELLSRKSLTGLFHYIIGSPLVFLLNTLLILTPFLMTFFTRRKVFLASIVVLSELTMGIANGILLVFRTTPFTASDLGLFKYAVSLLTLYLTWWQIMLMIAAFVAAGVFCVILWRKAPVEQEKIHVTESVCVAAVSMTVIWGSLNLAMLSGIVALHFGNIGQAYEDYGFAYCFANSAFNTGIEKPEVYDSEAVAVLEKKDFVPANPYSLKEHTTPNIIMVQLESFFDPTLWENHTLEKDPIPFYRFLMKNFPSGYLSVPSVGAGTANTEFECITGMNLDFFGPGEYPYKTVLQKTVCESMAFDMKNLGYKTHAIHNNEATFYDRHKVFAQLGFDSFTPIEYMYDTERNPTGWCRDKVLVGEIEKTLDSSLGQDFIYTISVQGHGKYPSFEYYCEQIHEMDTFVKSLVWMLKQRKEPTVLVLYGDHLPGFEWTQEEMKNRSLFQTEYVIWNNLDLPNQKMDVEAYQLTSHVLNLLDIHEGTMARFHQRHLDRGDTSTESYLDAMKILEYDILYGDQEVYGGNMPYHATKLEFGITPIIQRTTLHQTDQIIVFGEQFNAYSKICVDGKAVDTPYYQEGRLIAPNVPYKEGEVITVQQIGRDKVSLGTARKGAGAR
ncbi:MAG: LTA synthase family protein [Lachnospiraceae bacterium]|nr:LTA synthase family protein [Lachnospiraceae bacterium]